MFLSLKTRQTLPTKLWSEPKQSEMVSLHLLYKSTAGINIGIPHSVTHTNTFAVTKFSTYHFFPLPTAYSLVEPYLHSLTQAHPHTSLHPTSTLKWHSSFRTYMTCHLHQVILFDVLNEKQNFPYLYLFNAMSLHLIAHHKKTCKTISLSTILLTQ